MTSPTSVLISSFLWNVYKYHLRTKLKPSIATFSGTDVTMPEPSIIRWNMIFQPVGRYICTFVLQKLRIVWWSNIIHEVFALWLFRHFIGEPTKPFWSQRVLPDNNTNHWGDSRLSTYYELNNCLLETYVVDDIFGKLEVEILKAIQLTWMITDSYSESLCKSLVYASLYMTKKNVSSILLKAHACQVSIKYVPTG